MAGVGERVGEGLNNYAKSPLEHELEFELSLDSLGGRDGHGHSHESVVSVLEGWARRVDDGFSFRSTC